MWQGSEQRPGGLQVVQAGRNEPIMHHLRSHLNCFYMLWHHRGKWERIFFLTQSTHDALLFQMDLGKQLQEPYVLKFLMSMITVQSFLLTVKPSALPLHQSLYLQKTLKIILMGLLLPSVLLISHQGLLIYGISDQ